MLTPTDIAGDGGRRRLAPRGGRYGFITRTSNWGQVGSFRTRSNAVECCTSESLSQLRNIIIPAQMSEWFALPGLTRSTARQYSSQQPSAVTCFAHSESRISSKQNALIVLRLQMFSFDMRSVLLDTDILSPPVPETQL